MSTPTVRRIAMLFGVCVTAAALAACARPEPPPPVLPIGGDFALTDHNGQHFELSSLRGKAVLIFFGYTFCPDACPTTLSKLASVYAKLGSDASRVKTLYITVDPDRDTPAVLKADLSSFELDALGLTGTKADIDRVVALYGAAYEIEPMPNSAAKYSVAHTTTIYALDTAGRTRMEFDYDATVDQIVKGIRAILSAPASPEPVSVAQSQPLPVPPAHYALRGKVVSIDKAAKKLMVDHDAIPGFMGAMTMAYPVKDAQQLDSLSPGDMITASVVQDGSGFWLEEIAVAGRPGK